MPQMPETFGQQGPGMMFGQEWNMMPGPVMMPSQEGRPPMMFGSMPQMPSQGESRGQGGQRGWGMPPMMPGQGQFGKGGGMAPMMPGPVKTEERASNGHMLPPPPTQERASNGQFLPPPPPAPEREQRARPMPPAPVEEAAAVTSEVQVAETAAEATELITTIVKDIQVTEEALKVVEDIGSAESIFDAGKKEMASIIEEIIARKQGGV